MVQYLGLAAITSLTCFEARACNQREASANLPFPYLARSGHPNIIVYIKQQKVNNKTKYLSEQLGQRRLQGPGRKPHNVGRYLHSIGALQQDILRHMHVICQNSALPVANKT